MKNDIKTSKAVYFDDAAIKHKYLAENPSSKSVSQAIRTVESEHDFKVSMKLSMLTSTFMDISIREDELIITSRGSFSHKKRPKKPQDSYRTPDFMRVVELPEDIDPQSIRHRLNHGILTLSMKKKNFPTSDLPDSLS